MNLGVDLVLMIGNDFAFFADYFCADSAMQDCNHFGNDGASAIAEAFQFNNTVQRLYLVSYTMQS